MGQVLSQPEVNEVVLVPPLFERDHKVGPSHGVLILRSVSSGTTYTRSRRRVLGQQGRSRMAKSSYDFLFCKAQLRWLFNDYMRPGGRSLLHFSPSEDPRLSVTARLRTDIEREHLGDHSTGALERRSSKRATCSALQQACRPSLALLANAQVPGWAAGTATIRFQASPVDPLSFFDVRAAAQARVCVQPSS